MNNQRINYKILYINDSLLQTIEIFKKNIESFEAFHISNAKEMDFKIQNIIEEEVKVV